MGQTVQIGKLADAVMETLEEYADLAAEDVKQAARELAVKEFMEYISDYREYTPAFKRIGMLMVSYAMSCMRFKARKPLMSFAIILGMFPGVLSMIAIYFVMKLLGLSNSLMGLVVIYSAGSGLGYLICKGFFDTIPVSLRESAKLEGASELTIFTKIVIPLSKPMIVYTVINSFLAPWMDFVMAKLMIRSKDPVDWTVAMGLFTLVQRTLVSDYFSVFCAGGIIVAIPISILFLIMQKFYVEGITGGAVKG